MAKCKHEWVFEKRGFYPDESEYELYYCKFCLASALVEFPDGVRFAEITELKTKPVEVQDR